MENIVLTVHLLLALALVGVVLIQRSEGGGLGMGSGGGDSVMSGRAAASALTKLTWIFAVAFIITSISLTVIAANKSSETFDCAHNCIWLASETAASVFFYFVMP